MFTGFEKIVEKRISDARREGAFDNLPHAGMPLDLLEEGHIPEDLRLGYKILKNADCLPPEIELNKKIRKTEALLSRTDGTAEKYRLLEKLNFLIMHVNMLRNTRVTFELPQQYADKVFSRLGGGICE